VTSAIPMRRCGCEAADQLGQIDILVNNAL
jgi:hypothetical protein